MKEILTEELLYQRYNYFMSKEHGRDIELLVDIMKCNGFEVDFADGKYVVVG